MFKYYSCHLLTTQVFTLPSSKLLEETILLCFFLLLFTTNKFNKLKSGHIPGITCNSLHLSMAHCWLLQNCPLSQTAILQYKRYKKDLEKCCVSGSGSKSGLLSNVCKNKKLAMILLQPIFWCRTKCHSCFYTRLNNS